MNGTNYYWREKHHGEYEVVQRSRIATIDERIDVIATSTKERYVSLIADALNRYAQGERPWVPEKEPAGTCPRCEGCGQVDNADGLPWTYWENLPVKNALGVVSGMVEARICRDCHGTGRVNPKVAQP